MAFKRKKPIIQGTAAHKEALKLNKTMDKSSMPDGRPKSIEEASISKESPTKLLKGQRVKGTKNRLPGLVKVKKTKKEDSRELAAFKQQMLDRRKADKQAEKDAKKAKKNKGKKKKDPNWKVKVNDTSIGNASNPELQKKNLTTEEKTKKKLADANRRMS
tara:strand:+ start:2287 stop:2766 length:480 start_codon:yes stop_codon:yes gene_type:complete